MKTLKLPDKEAELITELSKKTSLSKERVVKNAIRAYIYQKRWRELQKYGEILAKRFKIVNEAQVSRLVDKG